MSGYQPVSFEDPDVEHPELREVVKGRQHGFDLTMASAYPRERVLLVLLLPLAAFSLLFNLFLSFNLYGAQCSSSQAQNSGQCQSRGDCVKYVSSYTPALDAIEYYETDLLHDVSETTTYRGPPTRERDQAWLDLWPVGSHDAIMIEPWAMELLNRTNFDPYVKVPPEHGEGYAAWLEVHQQLECLNLIRRYTWFQDGGYPEDGVPPELQKGPEQNRMHVDYCIERLRVTLMCHGDMTPLLVTKKRDESTGWRADFHTHHKCRNFTQLQEWVTSRVIQGWERD